MSTNLPPVPREAIGESHSWREWFILVRRGLMGEGGISVSIPHNDTTSAQGGSASERYHLTSAQHTDLTDAGDSTLHYHATDRARANHTGTQAASTITGTALVNAAIGTTVQAYDSDLTTWAGVTPGTGVATALAVNVDTAGSVLVNGGTVVGATVKAANAAGFISSDGSIGYTGTVTSGSLVGKTITIKDGIITGFA